MIDWATVYADMMSIIPDEPLIAEAASRLGKKGGGRPVKKWTCPFCDRTMTSTEKRKHYCPAFAINKTLERM